jgi:tetratricopeptide (TPR) repeat protein
MASKIWLLLAELRRRKVGRAAMAYVIAGFGVIEGADLILPRLSLPDWTVDVVLWAVLLGFPVALVLSWFIEFSPEGIRRTAALTPEQRTVGARAQWSPGNWVLMGAGLLVVAAAVYLGAFWSRGSPVFDPDLVAVIPFSNETGDPAHDQTGKIVPNAVAEALDRTEVVRVAPSSEVSLFWTAMLERKRTEPEFDPLSAVAGQFNAGTLVWGSLFLQGEDSLRLDTEISEARGSGRSRSIGVDPVVVGLDDVMGGIERVRERVAAGIVYRRDPTYGEWATQVDPVPSFTVYDYFTRANEVSTYREMQRLLELALQEDSTFLPAKMDLAVAHLNMGHYALVDSLLHETESALDRMAPVPRATWAWTRATLDGDRNGAYLAAKNISERSPSPPALYALGFEALRLNRPKEAWDVLSGLDPDTPVMQRNPGYWAYMAEALHVLGRHRQELEVVREGRIRHPDLMAVLEAEIRAQAALGNTQAVLDLVEEAIRKAPDATLTLIMANGFLRAYGHMEASRAIAERALEYLENRPPEETVTRTHRFRRALILYGLERWDDAYAIVEKLVEEDPSALDALGLLGTLSARRGDTAEASRVSQVLEGAAGPFDGGNTTYWRACIAALLGEKGRAVDLLRQAHQEGRYLGIGMMIDMDLESLRDYPQFQEFIRPRG